jgi:HSP20 family molecular chaperone IbpA
MSKLNIQKVPSAEDRKLPIFDELDEIADRIRVRAFNLFANRGFSEGHDLADWFSAQREICWPAAELVEEDDEFEVKVALAGFEPEDITVTATPRQLIVKATRKDARKDSDDKFGTKVCWSEFHRDDVYREIALPADVDVGKTKAEFAKGMLEIEAPKVKGRKKPAAKKKPTRRKK